MADESQIERVRRPVAVSRHVVAAGQRWTLPQPIRLGGATRWRRDEVLAAVEAAARARDLGGTAQ